MTPNAQSAANDWRVLYPFMSHWADVLSGRMHYLDEGPHAPSAGNAASTLLFVHGNPTWSFHWRRLIGASHDARAQKAARTGSGCRLSRTLRSLGEPPRRLWFCGRHSHVGRTPNMANARRHRTKSTNYCRSADHARLGHARLVLSPRLP